MECSLLTLNDLFNIEIDFNVRVNFKSVVDIVEALGGITEISDQSFSTISNGESYSFIQGENYLKGKQTLVFARERHNVDGGDHQRGKNQEAMITGILNKAMSSAILSNFSSVLNAVTSNTRTNFSTDNMIKFIQMQLNDNAQWDITSIAVSGIGDNLSTYTYGNTHLYVMVPDQTTIDYAKSMIDQIIEK